MRPPSRQPDKVIGPFDDPYMLRWNVFKGPDWLPRVYIHRFFRSDDERGLHDHPWWFFSIVLSGGYFEVTDKDARWRGPWSVAFRRATTQHRVALADDMKYQPLTLFIAGRVARDWGFWCRTKIDGLKRFVPFDEFDGCE